EQNRRTAIALCGPRGAITFHGFIVPFALAMIAAGAIALRPNSQTVLSSNVPPPSVAQSRPTAPAHFSNQTPLPIPASAAPAPTPESAFVQPEFANVRQQPTMNATVIRRLKRGERVYIAGASGGWRGMVDDPNDPKVIGWIHRSVIGPNEPRNALQR